MEWQGLKAKDWIILTSPANSEQEDDCACPDHGVVLRFRSAMKSENDCACPDHGTVIEPSPYQKEIGGQDCACANPTAAQIMSKPHLPLWRKTVENISLELPGGFHLAFDAYSPNGPCVLDPIAWEHLQAFAKPQPVLSDLDQVLAEQHLIHPLNSQLEFLTSYQHTFTAWMHVTNACNLDCHYCYVNKSSAAMNEATGVRALEQIFLAARANNFKIVKLKYAGGEPTLNFQLVKKLQQKASRLAERHEVGLEAVILSNGISITLEQVDWLLEHNVHLMISLDGIGEAHDALRPCKKAGVSSFAALARTIDQILLPRGLQPHLSMTITQQNAHSAAETTRWALKRGLRLSLNFYRQNARNGSEIKLDLEEQTIIEGMQNAYAVYEELLPEKPFINDLLDRVHSGIHLQTCGVGNAYVVISHDGNIAQCQMCLEKAAPLTNEESLMSSIQKGGIKNLVVDEKTGCKDCLFRYRCTGGCSLETYRLTGRWDTKSPHCNIYRTLFPEALRLEGLRLLKVNGYLH